MKKNILEYWLIPLVLISGFFSFFTIYRAIKVPESSTWLVPMIWISLFVISILIMTIFARYAIEVELVALLSLLISVSFAFNWWHLLIVIIVGFLFLSALEDIRRDLDLNVKISLWKSLYTGKFKMIFALAIIICSQYFFTIKNMDGQVKVPRLDLSAVTNRVIKPIFGELNPNYKELVKEETTVDQYILDSQSKSIDLLGLDFSQDDDFIDSQIPKNLSLQEQETLRRQASEIRTQTRSELSQKNKELILKEGRLQLSKSFGRQLNGQEKMADVIVSPVGIALNRYFQVNIEGNNQSAIFPLILSIVLFFTIWSIGSLLSVFWFWIIMLTFKLLVYFKVVKIEKITVERQIIA